MFHYYLLLGLRNLRRNPMLTTLMVLTLAVGVAASIATLTILHIMSGNPNPAKSSRLIVPWIDVAPKSSYVPGKKQDFWSMQSTYRDALNYLRSNQGVRRTVLYDVSAAVEPPRREDPLVDVEGIAPTRDFFAMFDVPFKYGAPWSAADDERASRVAVLSRAKAEALFGPGDPVGAVAVYEARAYPASAVALEATTCLSIPRQAFFSMLESYPTMVRGLLIGLTHRLVELTNRLTELSGGRIEARLARFFLKLSDDIGQKRPDGIFIPMQLSRQEIADMIGTTIETSIRIMSRWGKQEIVRTEKDGFLVVDRAALETVSLS